MAFAQNVLNILKKPYMAPLTYPVRNIGLTVVAALDPYLEAIDDALSQGSKNFIGEMLDSNSFLCTATTLLGLACGLIGGGIVGGGLAYGLGGGIAATVGAIAGAGIGAMAGPFVGMAAVGVAALAVGIVFSAPVGLMQGAYAGLKDALKPRALPQQQAAPAAASAPPQPPTGGSGAMEPKPARLTAAQIESYVDKLSAGERLQCLEALQDKFRNDFDKIRKADIAEEAGLMPDIGERPATFRRPTRA